MQTMRDNGGDIIFAIVFIITFLTVSLIVKTENLMRNDDELQLIKKHCIESGYAKIVVDEKGKNEFMWIEEK